MLVSKSASSGSGISNFAISSAIGSLFSSNTRGESSGAGDTPPPSAPWSEDISDATLDIFLLLANVDVEDVPESARFNAINDIIAIKNGKYYIKYLVRLFNDIIS